MVLPTLLLLSGLCREVGAAEVVLAVGHDGGEVAAGGGAPISLDLQEAEIRSVLRLFAEHAGVNFVLDDRVQGTVTVSLVEVPWDLALAAILAAEGLAAVPMAPAGQPPAVYVVGPAGGG